MNKVTLYSKSRRQHAAASVDPAPPPAPGRTAARMRGFLSRYERILLVAAAVLLSIGAFLAYNSMKPPSRQLTQHDVDAAVLHTLDTNVLPSRAAKAYDIVKVLYNAGKNPTRASLMAATQRMNWVNPYTIKGIKIKTGKSDRFPISQLKLLRYGNGTFSEFGPLIKGR
jgi:hypothetical protein